MPRILITGNGFDLHNKLPTTYKDFIRIVNYLSNNEDYCFSSIYENSETFQTIEKNFKNDIKFDESYIQLINETAQKNLLFKFFSQELQIEKLGLTLKIK